MGSNGFDESAKDALWKHYQMKRDYFENMKKQLLNAFQMAAHPDVSQDILENVNFQTKLELFSNYAEDPQNVDVNWEILFGMKVNKYITASLSTQLIYDDNTIIKVDNNDDGIIDIFDIVLIASYFGWLGSS